MASTYNNVTELARFSRHANRFPTNSPSSNLIREYTASKAELDITSTRILFIIGFLEYMHYGRNDSDSWLQ